MAAWQGQLRGEVTETSLALWGPLCNSSEHPGDAVTALVLLEMGSAAERCHSPDCVLPAFTAAAPGPLGFGLPPTLTEG